MRAIFYSNFHRLYTQHCTLLIVEFASNLQLDLNIIKSFIVDIFSFNKWFFFTVRIFFTTNGSNFGIIVACI